MDEYKKLLKEYVKYKSISTDASYLKDIEKTAGWLEMIFKENKFTTTIVRGYDNPIIVASFIKNKSLPTCLVYGHYDVQPAQLSDGWKSDPFMLREEDGRLFCRGAVDNKGQNLIHIISVFKLIKEDKLKFNVKFMLEANEETGSPSLEKFIKENEVLLKCDFSLISDGEITQNIPTIELGFRGGFNMTLKMRTSSTDLHSGLFGGAAPNAAHELIRFLDKIYDKDERITINRFYDDVDSISEEVIENNKKIPFSKKEYKYVSGAKALILEKGFDYYTATSLRPTIQVTGIKSGYMGEGYRNSIPSYAEAKLNFRLVLSQNPDKIMAEFKEFVKKNTPFYVDISFEESETHSGIKLSSENEYTLRAANLLEKTFGIKPIYKYCGGGLPIVTFFNDILKIPNVLVPLGNEDCKMHAADENFLIDCLQKGLKFSEAFFAED